MHERVEKALNSRNVDIRGKKIVDCAGVALINNGRVFLIRPLFNGIVQQFGLPKGHVERGESIERAAVREFMEETGIDINNKERNFLGFVYAKIDDDTIKKVTIYTVHGDGNETFVSSNNTDSGFPENIDGRYIEYETALKLITTYQQPLIKKLISKDLSSFKNIFERITERFKL